MAAYCWSTSLKPLSIISVGTLGMLRAVDLASSWGDVSSTSLPPDVGWLEEGRRCFWEVDVWSGVSSDLDC